MINKESNRQQHTYLGFGHFLLFLGKGRDVWGLSWKSKMCTAHERPHQACSTQNYPPRNPLTAAGHEAVCRSLGNYVVLTTTCVFLTLFLMWMSNTRGFFYIYLCTDPEIVLVGIFLNEIRYHESSIRNSTSALTSMMSNLNDSIWPLIWYK